MDAFHSLFCHQNVAILEPDNFMIYITQENKHIEDYLDYYCNLSHAPKFAVLIKGKWGCGKTWFIEKYREKLDHKSRLDKTGKKSLYISLYGVSNFSEIEDSIFRQLHPVLGSKQMVVAGKLFKGLLKASLRFDLDVTDDKTDNGTWNISIPDIERMKDKFNDSKFSLLIFDDLERCQIPLEELLGYINSFVDSQELKVVIISNEEEIIKKEEKYKKIKEKLIGQTFDLIPDLSAALEDFIKHIDHKESKKIFKDNFDFVQNSFNKSEHKNLRTLNKIVLDFIRIFDSLPDKAKDHPKIIQDIIEILIIFSIEIHQGELEPSNIGKLIDLLQKEDIDFTKMRNEQRQGLNKQEELQEIDNKLPYRKMFGKYDNTMINYLVYKFKNLFPNLSWWEDLFHKGIVDNSILQKTISDSIYFQDENTPNWKKLLFFYPYSDEEFKNILNSLESEYKIIKYEEIYEVKTITMLFFYFSKLELYHKDRSDILQEAKKYIDDLKDHNKLNWKPSDDDATYKGRFFFSEVLDYLEYQEFNNYLKESQEQLKINKIIDESQNLFKLMEDNLDEFCKIINKNITNGFMNEKYYEYPILKYADAEKFVSIISKIPNNKLSELFQALQLRYLDSNQTQVHLWGRKLIEEIDFLEQIQNLLLKLIDKRKGELSGYLLKLFKEDYLDKVVDKIKEEIENA
ncbi:P-loop NTPase fold protein [Planktothrix agardhii]|jgi:hypothetical protein|uniref:P-loop NTPase fold protein n=1 Tax=Planktothrix agardhii TaxID=1160 RepID=UPI0020A7B4EE|nr:P-loop NTPase fold protein [Planktothrix agardhii]CAD5984864.1 hypothetical protein NO365_04434 [Planktothrix agardhii]